MKKFKIKKMTSEEVRASGTNALIKGNLYDEEIDMLNHTQGIEIIEKNVKDWYEVHTSVHIATYRPSPKDTKHIEIWITFATCHFFKFKYYEDWKHIMTISTGSGTLDEYWKKLKPTFDMMLNSMIGFTFETHFG